MIERSPEMEELSRALFGQSHRLAVMVAIALAPEKNPAPAPDRSVNPTDLSVDLRLAQSAFQAPLRALEHAGLIQKQTVGRRNYYVRQDSLVWNWIKEEYARLRAQQGAKTVEHISA